MTCPTKELGLDRAGIEKEEGRATMGMGLGAVTIETVQLMV